MEKNYQYEYMFPKEFIKAVQDMPVFFVPTGLLEWHGDHLPLGQDALKAHGICLRTAEKLGGGIVLPPNYYGRPGFSRYVGTLTFSESSLSILFTELFDQLKKVGAKVIVLLTGHYGPCQVDFIKKVSNEYMDKNPNVKILAQPEYEGVSVDGQTPADHAGKWETSMFWHLYPDKTRMKDFAMEPSRKMIYDNPPHDHYQEQEEWVWKEDLRQAASRELGEKAIDIISDYLKGKILALLDEADNR